MKKGPLSLESKYAIKQMHHEGKSTEEISKILNRSEKSIKNYLDVELESIVSDIAKSQIEAQEAKSRFRKKDSDIHKINEEIDFSKVASAKMRQLVFRRLVQAGLTENDADKVINLAVKKAFLVNKKYKNADNLYTDSIKQMKAGDFINKKTQGGKGGVAVMSAAASQRMDDSSGKTTSKKIQKNIHRIREDGK